MWNYEVVDNFFDANHFDIIRRAFDSIDTENLDDDGLLLNSNKVFGDGSCESSVLSEEILKELDARYTPVLLDYMGKLAPKKLLFYDFADFHLVIQGKDYKHHIHEDDYRKLLSVVIYISPDKNNGTYLFETQSGGGMSEVEWKKNRALIFSRCEGESWHSFQADAKNQRCTVIYNLWMDDEKRTLRPSVLKAEGKYFTNYLLKEMYSKPYRLLISTIRMLGLYSFARRIIGKNNK